MAARSLDHRSFRSKRRLRTALSVLLVVASLLLAAALAACGEGDEGPSDEGTTGTELQYSTPPADGAVDEITWNLGYGEPTTVDPLKAGDYGPCFIASQMHDTLVRYTPEWELQPCIAESWDQVDDLTLVYTIRQDAKFWDGSPVTVDDVLFSMKRHMDPETGSIWAAFYSYVESIEKTGDWEVTVKFTKPDELFNKEMGTVGGAIVKKDYVEKVGEAKYGSGENVMGSGPYKMASWKPGEEIVLEANPDYWDPELAPKVAKVTVKFISDTSTVTSAILSGEIDGAYGIPATNIPALESAPGTIYYGPSLTVVEVVPTNGDTPMGDPNDPDVRTALSMAIDRQSIVDTVFNGARRAQQDLHAALGLGPRGHRRLPGRLRRDPRRQAGHRRGEGAARGQGRPRQASGDGHGRGQRGGAARLEHRAAGGQGHRHHHRTQAAERDGPRQRLLRARVSQGHRPRDDVGLARHPRPARLHLAVLRRRRPVQLDRLPQRRGGAGLLDEARQTFDPTQRAEKFVDAQAIYTADTVVVPLVNPDQSLYMSDGISGAPCSFAYMWIPGLAMIGGTE